MSWIGEVRRLLAAEPGSAGAEGGPFVRGGDGILLEDVPVERGMI